MYCYKCKSTLVTIREKLLEQRASSVYLQALQQTAE